MLELHLFFLDGEVAVEAKGTILCVTNREVVTILLQCALLRLKVDLNITQKFQQAQNVALRLLFGVSEREHMRPMILSLHWPPVHFQEQIQVLF